MIVLVIIVFVAVYEMLPVLFILFAVLSGQWTESVVNHNKACRVNLISPCDVLLWEGDRTTCRAPQTVSGESRSSVFVQCTIVPCSGIFDTARVLLCCRSNRFFFKPSGVGRKHIYMTFFADWRCRVKPRTDQDQFYDQHGTRQRQICSQQVGSHSRYDQ